MAKDTAVRMELTEDLLKSFDFSMRVRGVDQKGRPITEPTPAGVKDWIVRDTKVQGFAARVYAGKNGSPASVSFMVQRKMNIRLDGSKGLKSATVRRTLDHYPNLSLKEARKRATIWLAMMMQGKDPAHQKAMDLRQQAEANEEKRAVFGTVYDDFVNKFSGGVKESTKKDRKKVIKWLEGSPLWKRPLSEITHEDVKKTFDPLFLSAQGKAPAPDWGPITPDLATAWKSFRYCSKAYHDAIARKTGGTFARGSSAFGLVASTENWPKAKPRQGRLDTDKLQGQEWLKGLVALRDHATPQVGIFADYVLCSLIWGGRRRETQLLRWDDLDFTAMSGMFRAENAKAKRDHHFPLTPWVVEILEERRERNRQWGRDGEWVFPSRQHGKPIKDHRRVLLELKEETGLWITAHDLRRTAATDTAGLTSSDSLMVSMTLAHSGGRQAVTQDYITTRVKLLRPLFEARERRFRTLAGLSTPETKQGPIDALIEFLQAAQQDPLAVEQISKKADAMLTMFAN